MYVPAFGETIQTLSFATLGGTARGSCVAKGYSMSAGCCASMRRRINALRAMVCVRSSSRTGHAGSPYNRVASAGAEVIAHASPFEALVQLKALLGENGSKAFINFYLAGASNSRRILPGRGRP